MSIFWLWSLWMCGWIGGSLVGVSQKFVWKLFFLIVAVVIYALLLFKIDTIIAIT